MSPNLTNVKGWGLEGRFWIGRCLLKASYIRKKDTFIFTFMFQEKKRLNCTDLKKCFLWQWYKYLQLITYYRCVKSISLYCYIDLFSSEDRDNVGCSLWGDEGKAEAGGAQQRCRIWVDWHKTNKVISLIDRGGIYLCRAARWQVPVPWDDK